MDDEKKIDLRVDTDLPASSSDHAVVAAVETTGTDTVPRRDSLAAVAGTYLCAVVFLAVVVLLLVGYRRERDHPDQAVVLRVAYRHEYADWAPTCVPAPPPPLANSSQATLARCEAIATAPTVLASGAPCVSQFPSLCRPVYRNASSVFADVGVVRERYVVGTSNPYRYELYALVLEPLDSGVVCDRLDAAAASLCVEQWLDATRNRTATRRVWRTKNGPKLDDSSQLDENIVEATVWTVLAALWLALQCCVVVLLCVASNARGSAFCRAHLRRLRGWRRRP